MVLVVVFLGFGAIHTFVLAGLWVIVTVVACCVLVSLVFGVFLTVGVCAE